MVAGAHMFKETLKKAPPTPPSPQHLSKSNLKKAKDSMTAARLMLTLALHYQLSLHYCNINAVYQNISNFLSTN